MHTTSSSLSPPRKRFSRRYSKAGHCVYSAMPPSHHWDHSGNSFAFVAVHPLDQRVARSSSPDPVAPVLAYRLRHRTRRPTWPTESHRRRPSPSTSPSSSVSRSKNRSIHPSRSFSSTRANSALSSVLSRHGNSLSGQLGLSSISIPALLSFSPSLFLLPGTAPAVPPLPAFWNQTFVGDIQQYPAFAFQFNRKQS